MYSILHCSSIQHAFNYVPSWIPARAKGTLQGLLKDSQGLFQELCREEAEVQSHLLPASELLVDVPHLTEENGPLESSDDLFSQHLMGGENSLRVLTLILPCSSTLQSSELTVVCEFKKKIAYEKFVFSSIVLATKY